MSREVTDQTIHKQQDGRFFARVEFTDNGEVGEVHDTFATFDEANAFVQAIEAGNDQAPNATIPEPADKTPEQAEAINSNVNPAPTSIGSEKVPSGEAAGATSEPTPPTTPVDPSVTSDSEPTEQGSNNETNESDKTDDGTDQSATTQAA
jgi:hypothetical protein